MGSTDILTVIVPPIDEHGMLSYFLVSYVFYRFQSIDFFFFTSLFKFIPRYLFFFKFLFIYDSHRERERERKREAETQAEGEAGSMHREPDVGFDPGSPGSCPGLKVALNR